MTGNALEQNYTVGHDNFLSTMLPLTETQVQMLIE